MSAYSNECQRKASLSMKISILETTDIIKFQCNDDLNSSLVFEQFIFKIVSDNSIGSYSLLRLRLKNPAHSVHVFLLPTQKTAEMPTINVIRYFIINKANSGRVSAFACKKMVNNKNFSDTF